MSIIERIQQGLDERPRTRIVLNVIGRMVGGLVYVGYRIVVMTCVFVGAGLLSVTLLALMLGPLFPEVTTDVATRVVWQIAVFSAFVGAVAGLLLAARRIGRDLDADTRPRAQAAHDIVAQAIVAEGVGAQVHRIEVGLVCGGGLGYAQPGSVQERGASENDRGVADLAVLLAAPSFDARVFEHRELRRAWREQAAELDHEVRLARALDPAHEGTGDPMAEAAQLARRILARVPGEVRESVEDELLRAGSLRGARFRAMLKKVLPVARDDAGAQSREGARDQHSLDGATTSAP